MKIAAALLIALFATSLLGAQATAAPAPSPAPPPSAPAASAARTVASTEPTAEGGRDRGPERRGMMLFERVRDLTSDLKLSAEQNSQIGLILARARQDFADMRADLEKMDPRDRVEHVRDLLTAVQGDIAKQLNPEQAKAFEQKVDAMREQLRNRLRAEAGAGTAAGATTRPGNQQSGPSRRDGAESPRGQRGAMAFERLKHSLERIELSPEQKSRVEQFLRDLKTKTDAIRQEAGGAGADVREKVRDLMQESRARLQDILSPAQQQKLRELMTGLRGDGAGRGEPSTQPRRFESRRRRGGERGTADQSNSEMVGGETMTGETMTGDAAKNEMNAGGGEMAAASKSRSASRAARGARVSESAASVSVPAIGAPAPELGLRKLDGGLIELSSLRGRVIVLEFGSYSSPSFRRRAPAMEQLKRDYGIRAQFFIVYTKEAHPAGGWEVDRNKDRDISIEQPATADARRQTAQAARDKLKITVPIVLDTMDDEVARKFGAGANSAVVIDRDGRLAARQEWFEPVALRRHIDAAIAAPKSPIAATRPAP
jgi:peroxiredoxin